MSFPGPVQILFNKDVITIRIFDRARIGPEAIFRRCQVLEAIQRVVCIAGSGPEAVCERPLLGVQRMLEMARDVLRHQARQPRDHLRIRQHAK